MKNYKISLLAILLTISSSAFSDVVINIGDHWPHRNNDSRCFHEFWNHVKTEKVPGLECKVTKPLKLVREKMYRPQVSSSLLLVGYWQGQYDKGEKYVETYKHTLVNLCNGGANYSEIVTRETPVVYDLVNPNLDDSITESFKLAPMTDREAAEAMNELKLECERG